MARPTGWDLLGGMIFWGFASGAAASFLHLWANVPEEVATASGFGLFFFGLVVARVWWLRRGGTPLLGGEGLTTGEMTAERLHLMEARLQELEAAQERVFELEERLELAERLLARGREPDRLARERTPP